ncbi:MAG: DUF4102 domain-containing protein, partial [Nitrospinae bacterium]|nr:DUF4102 domain-containing protein [Nitrospinota bacterium]
MVITPKTKNRVAPKIPLTLNIIEDAQPGINTKGNLTDRPYKIGDSSGLFLLVTPSGGKWWRFKYRFGGKEKLLSLGTYPEVGLDEARTKRDAFRALLKNGIDPSAHVREEREARRAEEARNVAATRFALENEPKPNPPQHRIEPKRTHLPAGHRRPPPSVKAVGRTIARTFFAGHPILFPENERRLATLVKWMEVVVEEYNEFIRHRIAPLLSACPRLANAVSGSDSAEDRSIVQGDVQEEAEGIHHERV